MWHDGADGARGGNAFATADCKFQLGNLAGTSAGYLASGPAVTDDPASECDEGALLLRKPDGNAAPDAPHLHFAVFRLGPQKQWWKGDAINPYPALRNASMAVAAR